MDTSQIISLVGMFILFIVLFGYVGVYFQKLSPQALKYVDYGSFATAGIAGVALYLGMENVIIRYIFFASIVVYFITLRHSIHKNKSVSTDNF